MSRGKVVVTAIVIGIVCAPAANAKPGHGNVDYPLINSILVTQPGVDGRLTIDDEEKALSIARAGGIEQALRQRTPGPDIAPPSTSELGPEFVLSYRVNVWRAQEMGVPVVVTQRVYPFAEGGPWVHTEPDERLAASGWWPARDDLLDTLREAGVSAPSPSKASTAASTAFGALPVALIVMAALLALGILVWMRPRPAVQASQ